MLVLNLKQLKEVSSGDKEFEKKLFDTFQEHFGVTFKRLEDALEKKKKKDKMDDENNAVLYSHDIKCSAANLGGVGVKAVSEKIEALCRVFQYDEAAKLLKVLEDEYKKMASAFKSYLNNNYGENTNDEQQLANQSFRVVTVRYPVATRPCHYGMYPSRYVYKYS